MSWIRQILLILVLCISVEALAATEVDSLAKDFEKTKKKIEEAELKQRQVLSALYELNRKIKKIVSEKGTTVQQRAFLEISVRQLTEKVESLEAQQKSQRTLLAERLRAIYKLGGPSVARFIFNSSNSATFERNLKILGIVAARDLELIKHYNLDLQDLSRKRKNLASKLENLKTVENKFKDQEKMLLRDQELKSRILHGIRKNKMFALNKIEGLREKSLQFNLEDTGLFDLLFKPSFADRKGELPIPVPGIVLTRFGLEKGEGHPYTISQKGIHIGAAIGTPVKSIFEGKITFIGALPGYGNTIIVDHGDHYYTTYAYTNDVQVKLGDEITQSQVLAFVGVPPKERSSGLYFEIRHFSEPYDPQQWMKGL